MDKKSVIISLAAAFMLAGCGKSDNEKASTLYSEAQQLYEKGEWAESLSKLHLIDSLYKSAVDVRRQAMHLRPQVIEKQTLEKLSVNDSLIAIGQWSGDSLSRSFREVSNAIERYYVTRNAPSDVSSRPGLYGRMSPDGVLYFVAVSPGIAADAIALNGVSSKVLPHDGERRDKAGNNQILTFLEGEVDQIIPALAHATESEAQLEFYNEEKLTGKLRLTQADVSALGHACTTASHFRNFKVLQLEKERLKRTLTVARNQIARTTPADRN